MAASTKFSLILFFTCSLFLKGTLVRRPSAVTELVALDLSRGCLSPNPLDRGKTSPTFSSEPRQVISTELARATIRILLRWSELKYCLFLAFGRVWRRLWERQFSMHLRSRNLPRPSASSPLDNRAPPMANASQVPDLEGLHHEIHGMAEQMRVMNENNARLIQLLAAANPQPQLRHPSLMSSNLAILIVRGIVLTTSAPNEQGIGTEHQVRPYVKGVPLRNLVKRDPELDAINTGTNAPITVDALVRQTDPPFTERVLRTRISSKFPPAPPARNRQKNASHLFTVHQKETESLKDFVKRFNQAVLDVEDPSDKVIVMAMMEGLRPEELAEAKRRRRGKEDHKRKEPDTRRVDYREEMRYKRPDRDSKRSNNRRPRTPPRRPEFNLPSLNTPVAQVLSEIKHEEFVKWPGKIKTDPQKRNRNKYCEFHRDHGHNTEDYFQLREQIADLIKRGYLRKYITDRPPPNSQRENTVTIDQLREIYKRSMEASDQVDVQHHPGRGMLGVPLGRSKKRFIISPRHVLATNHLLPSTATI
ncbi:hypothetical protein Acr_00g0004700 [Actinidia rufa]|uniref:Uncharacterized protein n=1 Tax=Actinidia rufa TaxID=165716 RepID=A0A7J0D7I3_9ERIC|nr:hypothetical protein Acr_00g0004700 [Actinidia rufa]